MADKGAINIYGDIEPLFVLNGASTTYAFRILKNGQTEHLYYGARIDADTADGLAEHHGFPPGNTSVHSAGDGNFSPEDMRYEISARGKGDLREPFVDAVYADGSSSLDFVYAGYEVVAGKPQPEGLPGAMADENTSSLIVHYKDQNGGLCLDTYYSVYYNEDVIVRGAGLHNADAEPVTLRRLMSAQIDMDAGEYVMHTFNGAWAREMQHHQFPLEAGCHVSASVGGSSSNIANPFIMISDREAAEHYGNVLGINLIYSGNHRECAEVSPFGKVRVLTGINPDTFSWRLEPGASFDAPEAVMTVSGGGYAGLSAHMHDFINKYIVRGKWANRERPVLLNSWEAAYFKINEGKLLRLAKAAKKVGIELFVMDDGWFKGRNDDTSSLGDWEADPKKLPNGIAGIASKVKALGLDFGIWVEPEMISENSDLYRNHPDWAMRIPGKEHSTGRNQMFLDLANPKVCDYVISAMKKVFSTPGVSYVKWDMNRNMTDIFSPYMESGRQGETAHRYVLGLYRIFKELTEEFPDILFEGCSAGGNRFDLGVLCYFPQIWASDDTDALSRSLIQRGYSYGYPQSVMSAHVSDVPNHQTLRRIPLQTRFTVAAFGVLGYECNLADMDRDELSAIKNQIAIYKKWRRILQYGRLCRGRNALDRNSHPLSSLGMNSLEETIVSPDGKKGVSMMIQSLVQPNVQTFVHKPSGFDPDCKYHVYGMKFKHDLKDFGGLVNYVSPVHVKQDGFIHNALSKFVNMESEEEEHIMSGSALNNAGIHVRSAFAASGYDNTLRFYPDFASRIYFYEEAKAPRALPLKEAKQTAPDGKEN